MKPKIAITMGDIYGIGPEIIAKAISKDEIKKSCEIIIFGSKTVLKKNGVRVNNLSIKCDVPNIVKTKPGKLAYYWIKSATESALRNEIDAIVTAPISKILLRSGHTEIFSRITKIKKAVMMFVSDSLKISLVTRHLPIRSLSSSITGEKIKYTVEMTINALKKFFNCKKPKILVTGFNPHAGEENLLGYEERKVIAPAIKSIRRKDCFIEGPAPPDTAFIKERLKKFDAYVAMYHDQGLIPFKIFSFEKGVNLTLGLPFIRTSPDHGVAYDIAGKGIANPESMINAIKLAIRLCKISSKKPKKS